MTITLPLRIDRAGTSTIIPSQTTTNGSTVPTPNVIPAIPAAPRFAPRSFRKTLSTPVHRTHLGGSSGSMPESTSASSSNPNVNLKRKLGVRAKTFEDLPESSTSHQSSSATAGSGTGVGREGTGFGFGTVPDDITYGLARTAQAVRRARRVIVVCGAGISTPAIPDFRSNTGLFKTLAKDPYSNLGASPSQSSSPDVSSIPASSSSRAQAQAQAQEGVIGRTTPGLGKRRKSALGGSFRRTRSFNVAASSGSVNRDEVEVEEEEREVASGSGSDADGDRTGDVAAANLSARRMTVGGVGGIRSGKDLFDVRCLSDPSLLPAHHSLLNTLHRLTQSTQPTVFHKYMKTLDDEGRLLRVYTQNIDGLESKVGLDLRAPGDVVEGMRIERKWKRERSRRELQLGQQEAAAKEMQEAVERSQLVPAKEVVGKDFEPFQACEPGSSRQSTPSRLSTADEAGDSLSEAERTLLECDRRSRSDTPQYVSSAAPDTPASARSVSSVRTDLSAQYGFLRTPTKTEPMPDPMARANLLPRAVPLHGVLSTMDCTRCSYSQNFEEYYPLPADLLSCPSCEETQEERLAANQRARSVGVLRASVLLYNEPSKHDTAIGEIVEKDVLGVRKDDRPDLLIVAGTTLKIPGVIKIVKQLSNALRMNYPDEHTRAKNRQRAANRKRKRKMRDEGLLPPEASDEEETETEDETEDEPFTVDNFPIRTILLNRDAPGKTWEDTFDVWVQGDLQDFMHSWVTHGPTPTDIEGTMEWMWKKGARERNRLAKAKLNGAFGPSTDVTPDLDLDLGLPTDGTSSRKKKINLSNRSKAERWMEAQSYGWERPAYFSQLVTVSKAEGKSDLAGPEKIDEEPEVGTEKEEVEETVTVLEKEPEIVPQVTQKKSRRSKKAEPAPEPEPSVENVEPAPIQPEQPKKRGRKPKNLTVAVTLSEKVGETITVKPKKKPTGRKNPVLPFPASKPGSTRAGKRGKADKKTSLFTAEPLARAADTGPRPTMAWNRLVEGSLSPPPSSECGPVEDQPVPPKTRRKARVSIDLSLSADPARLAELEKEALEAKDAALAKVLEDEPVRRSTRAKRVPKRSPIA